jgi:hypothetical protein
MAQTDALLAITARTSTVWLDVKTTVTAPVAKSALVAPARKK